MPDKPGIHVGVRSAQEQQKAIRQLAELRNSGKLDKALVIAQMKDGNVQILAQEMAPNEIPPLLAIAVQALKATADQHGGSLPGPTDPPRPATPQPPAEQPTKLGTGYAGVPEGLVNNAWRDFAERLLANAGRIQRQEMRRAFYAGAQTLLGAISTGLDPGDEPTEADLDRMDGLQAELDAFRQALLEGKA